MRHFISMRDINREELSAIIEDACRLKRERASGILTRPLEGRTLAMIFEKASTRTRISFEVGMFELGGHALFLNPRDMQLGRGEEIRDASRVLSRYVSCVMIRAYRHSNIEEYARHSSIPVINGLSDQEHPCQILADLMTIRELFGSMEGVRVAWIGDGNNVCRSLILAAPLAGIDLRIASPPGYAPPVELIEEARRGGADVRLADTPKEAVRDADIIYTDVWVSMGDEEERDARLKAFRGYTVTADLLDTASPHVAVMHCLPAHRGEEIEDAVIEGEKSAVWMQAENRLHTEKALLLFLVEKT
ncbi:MAG: ornithine carbamoyltransferase [Methanomicrobiales archaeon]|nr:ornithine carbamoyltransferase [Methanomicrobiales archaeon]